MLFLFVLRILFVRGSRIDFDTLGLPSWLGRLDLETLHARGTVV
jgi:hypothetical protein